MRFHLDDPLNVVLTTGVCILLGVACATGAWLVSPKLRRYLPIDRFQSRYVVGEALDLPSDCCVGVRHTLVVFAVSNCSACRRALPFLRAVQLKARAVATGRLVLVVPRTDDERALAAEIGLPLSQIIRVMPDSTKASIAPTILVVDAKGTIRFVHEGALSDSDQKQVLRAMEWDPIWLDRQ